MRNPILPEHLETSNILIFRENGNEVVTSIRVEDKFPFKLSIRPIAHLTGMPGTKFKINISTRRGLEEEFKYYREYNDKPNDPQTHVGYYNFDCVIPRNGQTTLLVEIQGEYWHSKPKTQINDKRKRTYIIKHKPEYELIEVLENELKDETTLTNKIMRLTNEQTHCNI
jgi:hypothetical protein